MSYLEKFAITGAIGSKEFWIQANPARHMKFFNHNENIATKVKSKYILNEN